MSLSLFGIISVTTCICVDIHNRLQGIKTDKYACKNRKSITFNLENTNKLLQNDLQVLQGKFAVAVRVSVTNNVYTLYLVLRRRGEGL